MSNFTLPSFPRSPRPTPPRDSLAAAVAELKARLDAASVSFPRLSSAAGLHLVDSYADALALAESLSDDDVVLVGGTSWYYVDSHSLVQFDPSGADARLAAIEALVPAAATPANKFADAASVAAKRDKTDFSVSLSGWALVKRHGLNAVSAAWLARSRLDEWAGEVDGAEVELYPVDGGWQLLVRDASPARTLEISGGEDLDLLVFPDGDSGTYYLFRGSRLVFDTELALKQDVISDLASIRAKANSALQSHQDLSGKADLSLVVPAFDLNAEYDVNDLVRYEGTVYRCVSFHTGRWVPAHFTTDGATVGAVLARKYEKPTTGIPYHDLHTDVVQALWWPSSVRAPSAGAVALLDRTVNVVDVTAVLGDPVARWTWSDGMDWGSPERNDGTWYPPASLMSYECVGSLEDGDQLVLEFRDGSVDGGSWFGSYSYVSLTADSLSPGYGSPFRDDSLSAAAGRDAGWVIVSDWSMEPVYMLFGVPLATDDMGMSWRLDASAWNGVPLGVRRVQSFDGMSGTAGDSVSDFTATWAGMLSPSEVADIGGMYWEYAEGSSAGLFAVRDYYRPVTSQSVSSLSLPAAPASGLRAFDVLWTAPEGIASASRPSGPSYLAPDGAFPPLGGGARLISFREVSPGRFAVWHRELQEVT